MGDPGFSLSEELRRLRAPSGRPAPPAGRPRRRGRLTALLALWAVLATGLAAGALRELAAVRRELEALAARPPAPCSALPEARPASPSPVLSVAPPLEVRAPVEPEPAEMEPAEIHRPPPSAPVPPLSPEEKMWVGLPPAPEALRLEPAGEDGAGDYFDPYAPAAEPDD